MPGATCRGASKRTAMEGCTFQGAALALLLLASAIPASAAIDVGAYRITPSPTAVMVTFANGPDSRGFSWQTDTSVTESEVRLVAGAASPADFETTPLVYTGTYVRVPDPDANSHKVVAKGLQPGTAYSYRLGGAGRYVYGRTDVKPRASNQFTILNFNDAQLKDPSKIYYWENTLAASVREIGGSARADFIINGGDFIDFNMKTNNVRVGRSVEWGIAADPVTAFYNGVPWVSSSGNHDYDQYANRMAIEYPAGLVGCESLDYGNVHVATIPHTGSNSFSTYAKYLNWLEADLKADVAKGTTDWRIVCLHWGPYSTGDYAMDQPGSTNLAVRLGGICASNKVDLVLQAHDHTFTKTLPYRWSGAGWTVVPQDNVAINLTPATCEYAGETWDRNPAGTYYLCCGCAGHRVGENASYAASTGTKSYVNRLFRIMVGKIAVNSKWANAGDPSSSDLPHSMFGVIRIDGLRLSYDFYMVDDDGSQVLYDKLRILKTASSGGTSAGGFSLEFVQGSRLASRP